MNCIFCGDTLNDDTRGRCFSLTDSCQFAFYKDIYLVIFYICDNKKIAIVDKDFWDAIKFEHPSFKREYELIKYKCDDHEEFEFVDRRILDTGFIF